MSFVVTTAIQKILALKAKKKIIAGGSSAGKTWAILPILIDKAARTPNLEISVVSESIPHLKKGSLKDFIKIMKMTGRWFEERYNATDRKYTFANGSYIEFFSPEAILGARRNILYINEAINIQYVDYHQLAIRTSGEIYLDFNPSDTFWAHTEVLNEPDAEMLTLTYLDNEARPENVDYEFGIARSKAEEEKALGLPPTSYWQNWCTVYIDGGVGSLQGTVFQFNTCNAIPEGAKFLAYGLDFGFSNDPAAVVGVWLFNKSIYLKEILYQTGLTNSDLSARLKTLINQRSEIIADSAEPKSIEDMRRFGYTNIYPASKGVDSVRSSIDIIQRYPIYVTNDSTNLIKEFRMYRWMIDKSGKAMDKPIDAFNHLIDGLRYVALIKLRPQSKPSFTRF